MEFTITMPFIDFINISEIKMNFIEFLNYDDLYCIKFMKKIGLLNNFAKCCDELMTLSKNAQLTDGYNHLCLKCKKRQSIRVGSFFEKSHLKLCVIFKILYLYSFDVASQNFYYQEMGLSTRTIVDWKNFIRDIYTNYILENSTKIGGEGVIVQIDESQLCKRKYHVGRILANQEQWIVGGIDESGNVFMKITTIRNAQTLTDIILEWVQPGSIIWTDSWKGYRKLDEHGYLHQTVNHTKEFVTEDGVHTNRIEATWGACKRKFAHIRNKRPNLMPSYLSEYVFKKKFNKDIFLSTIEEIKRIFKF